MINAALVKRTLRDYLPIWAAAALLILLFVIFFNFALDSIPRQQTEQWLEIPWIHKILTALAGADVLELRKPEGMLCVAFNHPLVWTVLVAFSLALASGAIAGEIDRGTMDLLATLPMSRTTIYCSTSLALLLLAVPLCWTVWVGAKLGLALTGFAEVRMGLMAVVTCNLCAALLAVCGLAMAVSAASSRRGTAVSFVFAVVFYSFVVNFLRAMWPALQPVAFTSYLTFYAPLVIVREESWPWGDLAALGIAALICWLIGLFVFVRRDIPAR